MVRFSIGLGASINITEILLGLSHSSIFKMFVHGTIGATTTYLEVDGLFSIVKEHLSTLTRTHQHKF